MAQYKTNKPGYLGQNKIRYERHYASGTWFFPIALNVTHVNIPNKIRHEPVSERCATLGSSGDGDGPKSTDKKL